jgi:biopolymer transport protein ExbB
MKQKLVLLVGVAFAALMLSAAAMQAQSPSPAASPGAAAHGAHKKTLIDTIIEGGWVMYPIGLCSILTVYLIGDGIMRTSPKRMAPPADIAAAQDLFRHGDYVGAYNYCKAHPAPLTNVLRVGVSYLGDGKSMTETAMSEELAKENSHIQTRLSYLSVIGVCTPMIGLLGTVTGMMSAFATLGTSGIGDPSSLAGAIGEVLVATASGLFIAIPAFGAFYYLRNRAVTSMHVIEDTVNSLFRKMPYDLLHNVHIGDEELFAAAPNWVHAGPTPGDHPPDHGHEPSSVHLPPDAHGQTVTGQAPIA